jgi:spore coat polysaccharide biosynthesis protein SpsF
MRTVAIVQARMTSSRLPGKVLRPILGRPMLELLLERLQRARRLDGVVVATTTNRADDAVEQLALRMHVGCFRGSESDVLDRVLRAARAHAVDVIVEITGDCPLVDPEVVDAVVDAYREAEVDYASNTLRRTFPRGFDTQVFSTRVLEDVARLTGDPVDHEHVSLYIYEHPDRYVLHNVDSGLPETFWGLRLTVDAIEDFALVSEVFQCLYPTRPSFGLRDVVELFASRPELIEINRHISQKAVR